jgi:hypothetical protein
VLSADARPIRSISLPCNIHVTATRQPDSCTISFTPYTHFLQKAVHKTTYFSIDTDGTLTITDSNFRTKRAGRSLCSG